MCIQELDLVIKVKSRKKQYDALSRNPSSETVQESTQTAECFRELMNNPSRVTIQISSDLNQKMLEVRQARTASTTSE